MNLIQLLRRFPDNESCRQYLIHIRWPDGVKCPRCECERVSELPSRRQWTCLGCRYRFSVTAGTIFHKTHLPLRTWFIAIYQLLNAKKSISSCQLCRELGITVETAWHLTHRIREAMRESDTNVLFKGIIQADEYFHGGKPRPGNRKKHPIDDFGKKNGQQQRPKKYGATDKQPVVGALETSTGKIRTAVLPSVSGDDIKELLDPWIDEVNAELHTDECRAYKQYGKLFKAHRVVNHRREYVTKTGVHTNFVESAWSLFDRAVVGSFHHVSVKHLQRYLGEFDSRFNSRKDDIGEFFDRVLKQADGRVLTMPDLVG